MKGKAFTQIDSFVKMTSDKNVLTEICRETIAQTDKAVRHTPTVNKPTFIYAREK